jgi:flagellar FliL protein
VAENEAPEGADGEEDAGKVGGKKKILIIVLVVLLLAGGGAGAYFGGLIGGGEKGEATHAEEGGHGEEDAHGAEGEGAVAQPVYYEMEEFLNNLSTTGRTPSFLKMTVTLQLKNATVLPVVEANKPRIKDVINTYVRELRPSDLSGSAGVYRLRREVLERMNTVLEPGVVEDVLFDDIIVQ